MPQDSLNQSDTTENNLLGNWDEPPLLLVVSAPSGAGKSTICRRLLQNASSVPSIERGLDFSVSTTTRDPRQNEVDGEDYHFVDRETFETMIDEDAFLEWAEVHGELYGTARESVREALDGGKDLLLEIDVQGGKQVMERCESAVLVFVAPPSLEELERRLRNRDTESEEEIQRRLEDAREELKAVEYYDYVVINDRINKAVSKLESIRLAEKCRLNRQLESDSTNP